MLVAPTVWEPVDQQESVMGVNSFWWLRFTVNGFPITSLQTLVTFSFCPPTSPDRLGRNRFSSSQYRRHISIVIVIFITYIGYFVLLLMIVIIIIIIIVITRMWADAQRDGRPAEHRWRPLRKFRSSIPCTTPQTLADARCWSAVQ